MTLSTSISWGLVVSLLLAQCASGSFIDMDTPLEKRTTKSLIDGSTYELVRCDASLVVKG